MKEVVVNKHAAQTTTSEQSHYTSQQQLQNSLAPQHHKQSALPCSTTIVQAHSQQQHIWITLKIGCRKLEGLRASRRRYKGKDAFFFRNFFSRSRQHKTTNTPTMLHLQT